MFFSKMCFLNNIFLSKEKKRKEKKTKTKIKNFLKIKNIEELENFDLKIHFYFENLILFNF